MKFTRVCPKYCCGFAKMAVLTVSTLTICASSSIAQEIDIEAKQIEVELAPRTFTQGMSLELGENSVAIELRATGASLPLRKQCETFSDMREGEVIEGRAALRFLTARPQPQLSYVLRPVTPGWSERWDKAFTLMELTDNTRLSTVSEDLRPDVVGVFVDIELSDDDALVQEAMSQFRDSMNESLYLNRSNLRQPGFLVLRIDSLLVACTLLNEDVQFSFRHLLKGPNLISKTIAFNGELDGRVVERVEEAIRRDNSPSGAVNQQLPTVIMVRLTQSLVAKDLEISLEEISVLESFSNRWSGLLHADFRGLARREREELLSSLVEEDVRGLYLEHVGTTRIEAKLTDH